MPPGQPSLILTHHASAIKYAITAPFARNRQSKSPLSERVVFMLYLRRNHGFTSDFSVSLLSLSSFFFFSFAFLKCFYLNQMCHLPRLPAALHAPFLFHSSPPLGSCSHVRPPGSLHSVGLEYQIKINLCRRALYGTARHGTATGLKHANNNQATTMKTH